MGLFDKVVGSLSSAKEKQPDRCDVHMKLISLLKEATDRNTANVLKSMELTGKLSGILRRESVRIAEWEKKCEARLKKLEEKTGA